MNTCAVLHSIVIPNWTDLNIATSFITVSGSYRGWIMASVTFISTSPRFFSSRSCSPSRTYSLRRTQWAAVTTQRRDISVPPQNASCERNIIIINCAFKRRYMIHIVVTMFMANVLNSWLLNKENFVRLWCMSSCYDSMANIVYQWYSVICFKHMYTWQTLDIDFCAHFHV